MDSSVCESLRLTSDSLTMRYVQHDCQITLADDRTITLRARAGMRATAGVVHRCAA